ncbi:MAG: hypothetical protein WC829_01865 [Hyphomicrobium sp.]|jgi:hypothetical protein
MTIAALINEAANSGRLSGLTVWKTHDGQYQASISADRVSWRCATKASPAEAILAVLSEKPTHKDIFS